ncbi:hypothetical protein [Rhodococcus sp. AQ5-07]|uniref:ApeA N-terminal domain 1-containing protein n=1 Tax=Rhodococcus sp. AQ5-07 TaxID=2054902 RepID=UPI0012B623B7|nr:hypothetical protein [Rhodococcus sp. AQ5-07]
MENGIALNVSPKPGVYRCRWEIPAGFGRVEHPAAALDDVVVDGHAKMDEVTTRRPTRFWSRIRRRSDRSSETLQSPVAEEPAADLTADSFAGEVDLQADQAPKGTLYEWMPGLHVTPETGEASFSFPQYFHLPALRGYIEDSASEILLLDVTLSTWTPGQTDLRASTALVGVDLPPEDSPRFFGAECQISGIDAIGGFTPLLKTNHPPAGSNPRSGEWKATGNGNSTQIWNDDGAEVTHEYNISYTAFDPYFFRVGFTPVVRIEVGQALTLRDWIDHWITPVQRITSVATGREERITYLSLHQEDKTCREPGSGLHVFGSGITQKPFASRGSSVREARSAFTTARDELSLLELVRTWRRQLDDKNPILETYDPVLLRRNQHPRSRFLLLIQALEGLSGYQNRATFQERTEKHLAARERVLTRLQALADNPDAKLESADLKFVKTRISKRPRRTWMRHSELYSDKSAPRNFSTNSHPIR